MRKGTLVLIALLLLIGFHPTIAQETPRTLYVLNALGRTLSKMNLETRQITNDIVVVGDVPNRIHTKGDKIYVVNSTPPGITIIDGRSDAVDNTIALAEGSNPWDLAFVGADKMYVTNLLANSVTVVDIATGDSLNTIEVGENPEGILVVNNTAYVANTGGFPDYNPSTVSVIDISADQVTKTLAVPMNPQDLALAPDGNIHVVCTGNFGDVSSRVVVINPSGDVDLTPLVVDTVEIGGSPGDIVVTSDSIAYLADFGNGTNGFLYAYKTSTLEILNDASSPILVGNGAMNLLFDAATNDLYVNNFSDDAVQRLDAKTGGVVETLPFGDGAQDMAILEAEEPTSVTDRQSDVPDSFTLYQNYPNPFNPATSIEFAVAREARVQIKIFNLKGQEIRALVDRDHAPGRYAVQWDGKDAQARNVASGIYLYQMKVGEIRQAKRLTLLR